MMEISKQYVLAPMTAADSAEWLEWVRATVIAEAEARIMLLNKHGVLDATERRKILDAALDSLDPNTDPQRAAATQKRLLRTDRGAAYILYLHLRRHDAAITPEQAAGLFLSAERAKVLETIEQVNGMVAAGGVSPGMPGQRMPSGGNGEYQVDFTANPETGRHAPVGAGLPPQEQRKAVFDEMARRADTNPQGLVDMPIATAAAVYCQVTGAGEVDRMKLKAYLIQYAEQSQAAAQQQPDTVSSTGSN